MIILEYKVHADITSPNGTKTPDWVDDGGYWPNTDHTVIGVTRDNPAFYIPSTVVILTAQQLEDRQVLIHNNKTMLDDSSGEIVQLSESEVRILIQNWITEKEATFG